MTILKKFLERRSEYLTEELRVKAGENIKEETNELTDDEFWGILKQFKLETRSGKKGPSEILQEILKQYPASKINQFADRYSNLNK